MWNEIYRMFDQQQAAYERRFLEPDPEPPEAETIGRLLEERAEIDDQILRFANRREEIDAELAELGAVV